MWCSFQPRGAVEELRLTVLFDIGWDNATLLLHMQLGRGKGQGQDRDKARSRDQGHGQEHICR